MIRAAWLLLACAAGGTAVYGALQGQTLGPYLLLAWLVLGALAAEYARDCVDLARSARVEVHGDVTARQRCRELELRVEALESTVAEWEAEACD